MADPCMHHVAIPAEVCDALNWMASRSDEEIIQQRENVISQIENWGNNFRACGACNKWLRKSDDRVRGLASKVNGPLIDLLVKMTGHADVNCSSLFSKGISITFPPSLISMCNNLLVL